MFTEEQQTLHKHLSNRVKEASNGRASVRVVTPPHVPQGAFMYGISDHRVPSDVHPVPSAILRESLATTDAPWVLLLDGSVHLSDRDVRLMTAAAQELKDGDGLAFPVRYNFCPEGTLTTVFRDGTARFEYGVLPAPIMKAALDSTEAIYTGDVLLSEFAARRGTYLRVADFGLHRFPERVLLMRGRSSRRQAGLSCPPGVSLNEDFHRHFSNRAHDAERVSAFRTIMRDGEIARMKGASDTGIRSALQDHLRLLRPNLAGELEARPVHQTILKLMAAFEPFMDLFECRLDLLNFLVLLKHPELRKAVRLGDREFWSGFTRYTMNDTVMMHKLLYLKV